MNENENIIKPVWFESWFNKKFPDDIDYTPQEIAFAFRCSDDAIYNRLKSCEIEHIRNGFGKNSIIIPRQCIYQFALSCYCLNT